MLHGPSNLIFAGPPTVLVLASGRGERFRASGGSTHKLEALLGGKPVLEHTLAAVRASGLPWHLEQQGLPGMGDSIAAAVAATRNAHGWLILPADLPLVKSQTLLAVAAQLQTQARAQAQSAQGGVVIPVCEGQRGHPVGFAPSCLAALLGLEGNRGASHIVLALGAIEIIVNDPGIHFDIDTIADLQRAQRWLDSAAQSPIV